jgi:hypothetical protein
VPNFDEWLDSKNGWLQDDLEYSRNHANRLEPNEQLKFKRQIYDSIANRKREDERYKLDKIAEHPNFNQDVADSVRDLYKDHYEQEWQKELVHPTIQSMARFPAKPKKEVA